MNFCIPCKNSFKNFSFYLFHFSFNVLNLNLISREDKDMFQFLRYRRAVLYVGGVVGAVMVVFIILLIPSFLFLNFQRKEILRELAVEEEASRALGVEGIERRTLALNETIRRIHIFEDDEYRASRMLEEFASLAGAVKIGTVKIDFSAGSIEIDGVAPARNALLAFERVLEESDFIGEVSVRLSDLVKLTDVVFTLKGILQ